jgi:hypothetical protein
LYVNFVMNSRFFSRILMRGELKYLEEFLWHRPGTYIDVLVQFSEQCSSIYMFGYNDNRSSFRKYIVSNESICVHSERYFRHIYETQL